MKLLPISLVLTTVLSSVSAGTDDAVFLWSSTGGGWRAMMACVGFANVFQQAGLFTQDSSLLDGIATNSGASWFLVQLFYSQAFYNQTVMAKTPEDLYEFTRTWMESYLDLAKEATITLDVLSDFVANVTNITRPEIDEDIEEVEAAILTIAEEFHLQPDDPAFVMAEHNAITLLFEVFDLYRNANASWAWFIDDMLTRGTNSIGHEGDFREIMADAESRLDAMKATSMLIQTTLAPSSKVRLGSAFHNFTNYTQWQYGDVNLNGEWEFLAPLFDDLDNQDMEVFLGPYSENTSDDLKDWELYSVGLNAHYVVNSTFAGFEYATYDSPSSTTLNTYASPTSLFFDWKDYEGFYLWQNENFGDFKWPTPNASTSIPASQATRYNKQARNMIPTGTLRPPFGGGAATVIQAASISSAAAGPASAASPVVFAQVLSQQRDNVRGFLSDPLQVVGALTLFDLAVQEVYQTPLTDAAAVCTQWPEPCGPNDGYFLDGAFSDNPAVAINVANYQNSEGANLTKTIKLVLTNTNQNLTPDSYDTQQFTQYFSTDYNQDVPPGGYVWLPGFVVPYRSPQIFSEYLSDEDMVSAIEPIEGSNMTTQIHKATTLENKAFGTKAGQPVEIMVINTNRPVTTFIAALDLIEATIEPLSNMTWDMAGNQEMVDRVHRFFFGDDADSEGEEVVQEEGNEAETSVERAVDKLDLTAEDATETEAAAPPPPPPAGTEAFADEPAAEALASSAQQQAMAGSIALISLVFFAVLDW